jgi:glycosyltransferase involved in cell wall biosynthesis
LPKIDTRIESGGVSIAICCYNSSKVLEATLAHIARQRVRPDRQWEVVLVDNASTDGTAKLARDWWTSLGQPATLTITHEQRRGLAFAREKALQSAGFRYVSFVDDDNWIADDWVEVVSATFGGNSGLAMIGSVNSAVSDRPLPGWFQEWAHLYAVNTGLIARNEVIPTPPGAGLTIDREAWLELRASGYQHVLTGEKGCEDTELVLALVRRGYKWEISKDLRLNHYLPKERLNWLYLRRLMRKYAHGHIYLDAFYTSPPGDFLMSRLRDSWPWALQASVRRLIPMLPEFFKANTEGKDSILTAEGQLGRCLGLLNARGRYSAAKKRVRLLSRVESHMTGHNDRIVVQ